MQFPRLLPLFPAIWVAFQISGCGENPPVENPATHHPDSLSGSIPGNIFHLEDWDLRFEGRLNGEMPLSMDLRNERGEITGTAAFSSGGTAGYPVKGHITSRGEIILQEFKDNSPTAEYHGWFTSPWSFEGEWTSATGATVMNFEVSAPQIQTPVKTMQDCSPDPSGKEGVDLCHFYVWCDDCKCADTLQYPGLIGAATLTVQNGINRDVKKRFFAQMPECENRVPGALKTACVWNDGYWVSFELSRNGATQDAVCYDLLSGAPLQAEELMRWFPELANHLPAEFSAGKQACFSFRKEGIVFFAGGKVVSLQPWPGDASAFLKSKTNPS